MFVIFVSFALVTIRICICCVYVICVWRLSGALIILDALYDESVEAVLRI